MFNYSRKAKGKQKEKILAKTESKNTFKIQQKNLTNMAHADGRRKEISAS
jgi:hypothetical protein